MRFLRHFVEKSSPLMRAGDSGEFSGSIDAEKRAVRPLAVERTHNFTKSSTEERQPNGARPIASPPHAA